MYNEEENCDLVENTKWQNMEIKGSCCRWRRGRHRQQSITTRLSMPRRHRLLLLSSYICYIGLCLICYIGLCLMCYIGLCLMCKFNIVCDMSQKIIHSQYWEPLLKNFSIKNLIIYTEKEPTEVFLHRLSKLFWTIITEFTILTSQWYVHDQWGGHT